MIETRCSCGEMLTAEDFLSGRRIRCPKCWNVVELPGELQPLPADSGEQFHPPVPVPPPPAVAATDTTPADSLPLPPTPAAPAPAVSEPEAAQTSEGLGEETTMPSSPGGRVPDRCSDSDDVKTLEVPPVVLYDGPSREAQLRNMLVLLVVLLLIIIFAVACL